MNSEAVITFGINVRILKNCGTRNKSSRVALKKFHKVGNHAVSNSAVESWLTCFNKQNFSGKKTQSLQLRTEKLKFQFFTSSLFVVGQQSR